MRGVVEIVVAAALLLFLNAASAMEPIETPQQYGQLCQLQKISGHGVGVSNISVQDDELSISYQSSLVGDGDFNLDQVQVYSQRAERLQRRIDSINDTQNSSLNLFNSIQLTYLGSVPLIGIESLSSAIGAEIEENYEVTKIERSKTAFATSTKDKSSTGINNPVHIMGIDSKNSFDGTWSTDATWYEMLSKDMKTHQMLKGTFEIEKLIKFHESPDAEG